jgi:hypothetical protein
MRENDTGKDQAKEIADLLEAQGTLEQARALVSATDEEPDAKRREALADRIAELLKRHDTPEIAGQLARALSNAAFAFTFMQRDLNRRGVLVDRIGELLKRHDTPEIAGRLAATLNPGPTLATRRAYFVRGSCLAQAR